MAAKVDHSQKRPEDGHGGREELSCVKQAKPQRRIKLLVQRQQMRDLRVPDLRVQPPVIPRRIDQRFDFEQRHRDLEIRQRLAHPVQPVMARADRLAGRSSKVRRVFPPQHVLGLQHVGQRRGNMTYLVARRFLMPTEDAFVDQGGRRGVRFHRR